MRTIIKLLLFVFLIPAATAQVPAGIIQTIDQIFEPWNSAGLPGCAVGATEYGLPVFSNAYGMADLEWGIPNTPETIFEGGSVSKQFTAAAIALLILDEKLRLDDDVRQFIPELPDYGTSITVRHLLNHTSGLRDWGSVASISGWNRSRRAHTHEDVLNILSRQTELNYEPGAQYSYTNSGYNLMAILVDRVSGMSFAEFSDQRIFAPLGLESTQWRDDFRRIVKGRSSSYNVSRDGSVEINRPVEDVHGNGGILTTVQDLLTWNQALNDQRFGERFTELMEQPGVLNSGLEIGYAGGLSYSDKFGAAAIEHTGSTAGYRAYTGRIKDKGLAWALLCNASNGLNAQTGDGLVKALLGDSAIEPPALVGIDLPAERLQSLAGLYRERLTGRTIELQFEQGQLMADSIELTPVSQGEFVFGQSLRTFVFESSGTDQRPAFTVSNWQAAGQVWEKVDPWSPTTDELRALEGVYRSHDAETEFQVSLEDGQLLLKRRLDFSEPMEPTYQDGFTAGYMILRFVRDTSNAEPQLSVSIPRVFDMRFEKVSDI